MTEYVFYRSTGIPVERLIPIESKYHFFYFRPTIPGWSFHKTNGAVNLMWYLLTAGKYSIAYVVDREDGQIVHFSYILPKTVRFPFMGAGDRHIVGCQTDSAHRCRSLYTCTLQRIVRDHPGGVKWITARPANAASVRGIEKAGFEYAGRGKKRFFLGLYTMDSV